LASFSIKHDQLDLEDDGAEDEGEEILRLVMQDLDTAERDPEEAAGRSLGGHGVR
jgi:hypothetical protein